MELNERNIMLNDIEKEMVATPTGSDRWWSLYGLLEDVLWHHRARDIAKMRSQLSYIRNHHNCED